VRQAPCDGPGEHVEEGAVTRGDLRLREEGIRQLPREIVRGQVGQQRQRYLLRIALRWLAMHHPRPLLHNVSAALASPAGLQSFDGLSDNRRDVLHIVHPPREGRAART
jgi:hypothetical protein